MEALDENFVGRLLEELIYFLIQYDISMTHFLFPNSLSWSQDLASLFADRNAIIVTVNILLHLFAKISFLSFYVTGVLEPASHCFNHYSFVMCFDNVQCQFLPKYSFQICIHSCIFFLLSFDRWSLVWPIENSWILTETMYSYVFVWKSFAFFFFTMIDLPIQENCIFPFIWVFFFFFL